MRVLVSVMILVLGLLLLALGLVQYVNAHDKQREEQAARDAHWSNVQREAAKRFPPVLPGEEKPAPAPLQGVYWIMTLFTVGIGLCVVGLAGLVLGQPSARKETGQPDAQPTNQAKP